MPPPGIAGWGNATLPAARTHAGPRRAGRANGTDEFAGRPTYPLRARAPRRAPGGGTTMRQEIEAERREIADMLGDLRPEQWAGPTLCGGWRVREVVAHITMPFRMTVPRFV